jgi:hypothetical protein
MTAQHEPTNIDPERMRAIIATAVAGLTPQDRAAREAWCVANNSHGVRMFPASDHDDVVEFRWGNRSLAMVRLDDLLGDGPLHGVYQSDDVPDHHCGTGRRPMSEALR